jgi:hypothetical protein
MSWHKPMASYMRQPSTMLAFGCVICLTNSFNVFKYLLLKTSIELLLVQLVSLLSPSEFSKCFWGFQKMIWEIAFEGKPSPKAFLFP